MGVALVSNVGAAVEISSVRPWDRDGKAFSPILCSVNYEVFEMDKVSEFESETRHCCF